MRRHASYSTENIHQTNHQLADTETGKLVFLDVVHIEIIPDYCDVKKTKDVETKFLQSQNLDCPPAQRLILWCEPTMADGVSCFYSSFSCSFSDEAGPAPTKSVFVSPRMSPQLFLLRRILSGSADSLRIIFYLQETQVLRQTK